MDAGRFDALARRIGTRRALFGGVALLAAAEADDTLARKKCKQGKVRCPDASGRRRCVDTKSDAANCGACGRACAKGCVHGTCACGGNPDCPDGCACGARFGDPVPTPSAACAGPGGSCNIGVDPCATDADCPLGSFCRPCGGGAFCSPPCLPA